MKRHANTILLLFVVAAGAWAREPDGTLGLICAPHEGVPVLVSKAQSFPVVLRAKADGMHIEREGSSIALSAEWSESQGLWRGRCPLPADTPEGAYSLVVDANGQTDQNARSVFVYGSFPESYRFAQLTDIHVGAEREWGSGADVFRKAIEMINGSDAAFVLITGDLTHNSDPEQCRQFLEILNTCTRPTFLSPGNHDREKGEYERRFGDMTYAFNFGTDAYLSFDTKDLMVGNEYGAQDADLEVLRRMIRPARWAIGFTHRYDMSMSMHAQLTLFVDAPLDHLVFGHWHRANKEGEKTVPWGTTPFTTTPAAIDGYGRLFDVSPNGIKPQPPQRFIPGP